MYFKIMLILHILGATVWAGGHIVLATLILPEVLRKKDPRLLLSFEEKYERIGMPALLIQIITGLWMAYYYLPDPGGWFTLQTSLSVHIVIKLSLLLATVLLAVDARFRVIPRLSRENLTDMAWHIIGVTILAVVFVISGVSLRTGGLF